MEDESLNAFLTYALVERKYSPITIESYKSDLIKLRNFIKKDLKKATKQDIKKFNESLEGYNAKTKARILSTLTSFFRFMVITNRIKENPSEAIVYPKIGKHIPNILSEEEIDILLDIEVKDFYTARNKALLELMYSSGLRVSEVVNLVPNDIDLMDNTVRTVGKGNKERIIPIGDYATNALRVYINEYLPVKREAKQLFVNNHYKKMTRQGVFIMLKKLAKENGI